MGTKRLNTDYGLFRQVFLQVKSMGVEWLSPDFMTLRNDVKLFNESDDRILRTALFTGWVIKHG